MLIIFSGLPGVGKSTIARDLSMRIQAVYLRADTIEQTMRLWLPTLEITREGYEVAYALAAENLLLGLYVVADSVNPLGLTRDAWKNVAVTLNKKFLEIEIICSDMAEHRRRVEGRVSDMPGLKLPTWDEVVARHYEPWTRDHLILDTAGTDSSTLVDTIENVISLLEEGMRDHVAQAFQRSRKSYRWLYQKLAK